MNVLELYFCLLSEVESMTKQSKAKKIQNENYVFLNPVRSILSPRSFNDYISAETLFKIGQRAACCKAKQQIHSPYP